MRVTFSTAEELAVSGAVCSIMFTKEELEDAPAWVLTRLRQMQGAGKGPVSTPLLLLYEWARWQEQAP